MLRLALLLSFLLPGCAGARRPAPDPSAALEAAVRRAAAEYPAATVGVAVRDPASGAAADVNAERSFHAASTMKVPVMIEVFRQARRGRFSLDDSLPVVNAFRSIVDGSPYRMELADDSDDSIYDRIGRKMTIRDLTRQMIVVSSNLATNLLIELVRADSVQRTIERLGARRMRVLRGVEDGLAYERGLNNTATAADLAALLSALARGQAVSPEADREMVEILLDQRFNEMIPAGLPPGVRAAHKTGNITAIHHDAALVYPPGRPPYVLVVLIEGLRDQKQSAALGASIARAVHEELRNAE